jgi:sodium-dependent dicarboxylate transporter 2/3/5
VLLGVIVLWITEPVPIPVGGLIGVGAIVILGVVPADDALAPFGSTTVFTFIGAFILAAAMLKHGVARRFAMFILSLKWVGASTARVVIAFGFITAVLSAFVSNTATVAMLLPTAIGILSVIAKLLQDKELVKPDFDPLRLRVGVALMLMLAYGAGVGGLLTPVGSPPNLIGRGLIEEATGERIGFLDWMLMALPICALMFVALTIVLLLLNKPEIRRIEGVHEYVRNERAELGPFSGAERNTLIAFGITVALWIFPGIIALTAGTESDLYATVSDRLDEGIVAVLGASLLFLLPTDWGSREFTLRWSDAAKIDWGTILLFGTGIIFGSLLADTGLAETIGEASADWLGLTSTLAITVFAVILAIIISETTSNTASAAVVVPIIIPVAMAADINPFVPALAATFAASFGFMLPVSTPQNAIVYGSGVVPITKMIRSGISFDVLGALLIVLLLPVLVDLVLGAVGG